ncbi:hypothetical protein [Saccharothrix australiensis]|uniref:Uncharacterized protein n=1 Tax=Saccharothrix australiensis TaxID=2072 RepID=A0A495W4Y8_9PSEU|nr:hypothetical protein [Saccharothrix australiensis]RKT56751.1 hypothetical protein C8E97_5461 [Saccharothrix australiensis]
MVHRDVVTQMDFFRELAVKARNLTEITDPSPVDVGALGGFPYYFKNASNIFTEHAWSYITSTLAPKDASGDEYRMLGTSFGRQYLEYVQDVQFVLSSETRERLNQAEIDNQEAAQRLVADYERIFGEIDDDQLDEAGVETKVGYILDHQIPTWADNPRFRLRTGSVDDLETILPNRPSEADGLLVALCEYLNGLEHVLPIINEQLAARARLNLIMQHIKHPSKENGGMQTVGADGKSKKYRIAVKPTREPKAIRADLEKGTSSVSIHVAAEHYRLGEASLRIDGRAAGIIGWSGLLVLGTSSASYTLDKFAAEHTSVEIDVSFKGLSFVQFTPAPLSDDGSTGWFDPAVLREAVENDGEDVTGFHLHRFPARQVANFAVQQGLVLGNLPSIKVRYSTSAWNQTAEEMRQSDDLVVSLFGIPLSSANNHYKKAKFERDTSKNSFTITVEPNPASATPSLTDHRAHVLGVQVGRPFAPVPKIPVPAAGELDVTTDKEPLAHA